MSRTKQKEIMKWIAQALNEKYEREFAQQMRWIYWHDEENEDHVVFCQKCKEEVLRVYDAELSYEELYFFKFFPNCGQKLDKPN